MATINPFQVRFSQASIRDSFSDGTSVDDLAKCLRTGVVARDDIAPIRLCERDGKLFSLDNRRLEAFRRAGLEAPYRMATAEEIENEAWKFTTRNDGLAVRVR